MTEERSQFVQYLGLRLDPAWRRLPAADRAKGRKAFAKVVSDAAPAVTTWAYTATGLKLDVDLLLWWKTDSADRAQETLLALLATPLGSYLTPSLNLWGLTRPSVYTKRRTVQEQAIDLPDRQRYLIVYPFVKSVEWYLMSREARQGMMNEHMRVGHEYGDIRQVLLYSTGLDDQEFVVAYECEDLDRFQSLVIDLRATEARRYTVRDTPITTAIHRPLDEALALLT